MCDFPNVFLNSTTDLLPEREVEFDINLVPRTSLVLMARYGMSTSNFGELKKQLEELLKKKFV